MKKTISKITAPKAEGVYKRNRLFRLLDKARLKPLVWVTAPPGSGKTMLLASYLEDSRLPYLWYKADEGDSDLATFFYYMGLAAKASFRIKRGLPLLTPEYLQSVPTFARRYFEDLCRRAPLPFVMVLDNYQDIPGDALFHEMLRHGVEALPEGASVMVISRTGPPDNLLRLRANNCMAFIGWNDLRFTLEEVREAVNTVQRGRCLERDCPAAEILFEKTGGWAAGLRLMIDAAEPQRDIGRNSRPGDAVCHCVEPPAWRHDIFSYFTSEVLKKTDPSIRDFLLSTSFLTSITASVASRLTGRSDAAAILSDLSRRHYFTDWRPGKKPLYQYHPLFREFLLAKAREKFDGGEISEIMRTAAGLLEEEGFPEEAMDMCLSAGDFEHAKQLLLQEAWKLLSQGRSKTVERWLACLPEDVSLHSPDLLYIKGVVLLPLSIAEARRCLEKALGIFAANKAYAGAITVCGCILETVIIEGGSYTVVDHYVDMLDSLVKNCSAREFHVPEQISGVVLFALAFRNLTHRSIPFWLAKAETAVMKPLELPARLKLCNYLMGYYLLKGEYHSLTRILNAIKPLRKAADSAPVLRLLCMLLEAYHAVYALADADRGIAISKEAIEYGRHAGVVIYEFWFSFLIIGAAAPAGYQEQAEECLAGMMEKFRSAPLVRSADLMVLSGSVAMSRGDWNSAAEHYKCALDAYIRAGAYYSEVFYRVYYARALFQLGDADRALRQMALVAEKHWAGSEIVRYMWFATQAYCHLLRGEPERGRVELLDAFSLAREKGIMHAPFWNREHSARVCAAALEDGIEPDFVRQLVGRYRLVPPPEHGGWAETWPWPVKIYTLGRFEILKDGEPLRSGFAVQKKPMEALKAIIAFGGSDVPEEIIMDALWPDAEGDAARTSLKTVLHRLRQGLGDEKYVLLKNGRLSLSKKHCWVDVLSFQRAIKSAEEAGAPGNAVPAQKAAQCYRGPFLPDDAAQSWTAPMRERSRRAFIRAIEIAAGAHLNAGRPGEAAALYERTVEADELDEDICLELMECYARTGRKVRVAKTYERHCKALRARLDIEPSGAVNRQYEKLMKKI